jgi:hypothetical protein
MEGGKIDEDLNRANTLAEDEQIAHVPVELTPWTRTLFSSLPACTDPISYIPLRWPSSTYVQGATKPLAPSSSETLPLYNSLSTRILIPTAKAG